MDYLEVDGVTPIVKVIRPPNSKKCVQITTRANRIGRKMRVDQQPEMVGDRQMERRLTRFVILQMER